MESETEYVPDSTTGSDSADSFVIPLPSRCSVEVSQESQSTSSRVLISEATSSNNSVTTKSTLTEGNIEVSSTNSLTSAAGKIRVAQTHNDGTSRKWDKHQFCYYCGEPKAKLPRHLESVHREECDIQRLSNFRGQARKKQLVRIRNLGNHRHNCEVLREGKGTLLVAYRPSSSDANADDYGPCPRCFAYYVRRDLWRHMPKCPLGKSSSNSDREKKPVGGRITKQSDLLKPPLLTITSELHDMLQGMKKDAVSLTVKNDRLIVELAKREYMKVGHDVNQHNYLRTKLRELGRLLLQLRNQTGKPNASLESFIKPRCLKMIVSAVHEISGYDAQTQSYKTPSLALKVGHSLKKCAVIMKGLALEAGDRDQGQEADDFKELCESCWEVHVASHALRTLSNAKRNNPVVLPTHSDVVLMSNYLHDVGNQQVQQLRDDQANCRDAWNLLSEVTLCQTIMFNRRRQGEVSKMKVADFHKKHMVKPDGMCILSKLEQSLCKMFEVVEIVGKRGRTVPLLSSPEMTKKMSLLIEKRNSAGVVDDNEYLFARSSYSSLGHIRGSDSLRKHAKLGGAAHPDRLRSTKLRKHIATASQLLALSENQLELLASFMGHDLRIHREYYRVPDNVMRVAKLSKVFLALEKGTLPSQEGKTLDNMSFEEDTAGKA